MGFLGKKEYTTLMRAKTRAIAEAQIWQASPTLDQAQGGVDEFLAQLREFTPYVEQLHRLALRTTLDETDDPEVRKKFGDLLYRLVRELGNLWDRLSGIWIRVPVAGNPELSWNKQGGQYRNGKYFPYEDHAANTHQWADNLSDTAGDRPAIPHFLPDAVVTDTESILKYIKDLERSIREPKHRPLYHSSQVLDVEKRPYDALSYVLNSIDDALDEIASSMSMAKAPVMK